MEASSTEQRDFISYPTNRVVGTVADARGACATIEALLQSGFDRQDIDVLHGEDAMQRLDPTGEEHGFLAQFNRTLLRTARRNEEYEHLMRHVDDVRAGRFVIMVLAPRRVQRMMAADILTDHGAEFIGFYGRWAWEGLPSSAEAPAGHGPDAEDEGHQVASRPGEIPSMFAEAWNGRDPDRIAALFDEDAEFVNVTGLWSHNRASIREAHAYGLERIFNESTLTVDETRVRKLGEDVAVVHARMKLSGQTPVGPVRQPGSRTTIFSFVAHRTGRGWLCAAAHNTDVVPNRDTNIVDDEGALRTADYRSGRVF